MLPTMPIRHKLSVEQLVTELRRASPDPQRPLARWRQARLERKLGRIQHRQLLRAYYNV